MTAQAGLFESAEQILIDDPTGRIAYRREFLSVSLARDTFEQLYESVAWNSERRPMYDRVVDVPRLTAGYPLHAPLPSLLQECARRVREDVGIGFTHVGLNLYRDGHDSVAPHNDHLDELEPRQPIVLLSLGDTREMVIRAKAPPRRALKLELEAGSLLSMSYATQLHYDHGIPKQAYRVGPRISLAFRVRQASSAVTERYG